MAVGGTFGFARIVPKNFFFDRARVLAATDRATNMYLASAGGFVMRTARNSMRKARQKPISALSAEELAAYKRQRAINKRLGQRPPRRPIQHSAPGEAPRYIEGSLKRLIFFAYESDRRGVVIGPVGFRSSGVPRLLEYGGVNQNGKKVAPRPYMAPALEKVQPRLSQFWAQAYARANRSAG